jgi:hypothetical protein
VADPDAHGGQARRGLRGRPHVLALTRLALPPGRYRVAAALQVEDSTAAGEVARIGVWSAATGSPVAEARLRGTDFDRAGRYTVKTLAFTAAQELPNLLLFVDTTGATTVSLDYVEVEGTGPGPAPSKPPAAGPTF